MLLEFVLIPLAVTALAVAVYADLKTREVPDWLNYGLIFSALGIRAIFSLEQGWNILISGLLGFLVCFILACLFYYTHQWGGGDSKLLMGMGAVIGVSYPWNESSIDILWYVLAVLVLGAGYGLLWLGSVALRHWREFTLHFREKLHHHRWLHLGLGILSLLMVVATIRFFFFWPFLFLPLAFLYLFLAVSILEKISFLKQIPISRLTEGDWLAAPVTIRDKMVVDKKTLEREDLVLLKKLHAQGKVKKILIKEGIPFTPSFLLAYVVLRWGKEAFLNFLVRIFI